MADKSPISVLPEPITSFLLQGTSGIICVASCAIFWKHRENIGRMIRKEEIGAQAARCLIERIKNPEKEPERFTLPPYLVRRSSVRNR